MKNEILVIISTMAVSCAIVATYASAGIENDYINFYQNLTLMLGLGSLNANFGNVTVQNLNVTNITYINSTVSAGNITAPWFNGNWNGSTNLSNFISTNYVPYTGATTTVDLGYNLIQSGVSSSSNYMVSPAYYTVCGSTNCLLASDFGSDNVLVLGDDGGSVTTISMKGSAGTFMSMSGTTGLITVSKSIVMNNNINFQFSGTTGTKIGTATNQKLSFWNKAPVVQPTTSTPAPAMTQANGNAVNDSSTFEGYNLSQVVRALKNTGILA